MCSREYFKGKKFNYQKQNSDEKVSRSKKIFGNFVSQCSSRPGLSPMRLMKNLAGKVGRALCIGPVSKRASRKDSLAGKSKPFVTPVDSHRIEAMEDCIDFINSSSSLSRSNSTTNSC
ncbi:josephin-like protein [Ziziphus jujuba]|uniref:Josephin-like protein n=1 Tax=Ziziphus jujuba TaxID=326968 RepID=A0A6P6FX36_ZIZJJ|nr:josephin-like protein [Ziziphus jujuba]